MADKKLDTKTGQELYDPCCGSFGLLIKCYLRFKEKCPDDYAARNDYNLSPSRYVVQNGEDDTISLEDAVVLLKEAEEERKDADDKLNDILDKMGLND